MHWLTDQQKEEIRKLSLERPGEETCGFVLADGGVIAVENKAADPTDEFSIDPLVYAEYDEQIKGIWHSHRQLAGFSPLDQQVLVTDVIPWVVYCMADDTFHQCDPSAAAPLEDRPYVFGVYDCYSLVVDVLEGMGVKLPEWKRGAWGEWNTPQFRPFDEQWESVGRAVTDGRYRSGDILLFNMGDYPGHTDHIGVFVNSKQFLHHPASSVSRRQTFGGYWARRLNWVIRPHALWSTSGQSSS